MIRIVSRAGFEYRITGEKKVEDLFRELDLKEQGYVCLRNNVPVTRFDTVGPDDDVILMEIFSGG